MTWYSQINFFNKYLITVHLLLYVSSFRCVNIRVRYSVIDEMNAKWNGIFKNV